MVETDRFRRYLLGELDDSGLEAFEEELMTSDEHFQELLIAEHELVDDSCAGELDASQAEAYRERFLVTDERRRQHRFGMALRKHVSTSEPVVPTGDASAGSSSRPWKLIAAAVLVAAGVWSIREIRDAPFPLEQQAGSVEGRTEAFFLTRGSFRSLQPETDQALDISDGVAVVELQLDVPGDARDEEEYEVRLVDARSGVILAEGTLQPRTVEGERIVVAAVPSELLVPGEYRVVLRASPADVDDAALETFAFRVSRP